MNVPEIPEGGSNDFEVWHPVKWAGMQRRNSESHAKPGAHIDR